MIIRTHPNKREAQGWSSDITRNSDKISTLVVGTAGACKSTHLIHMLAKHATPMTASSTTLGRVPAKLSTRVINTRSMFVFESAAAIVKPPIRSMIVGENITEKTQLPVYEYGTSSLKPAYTHRVAAAGLNRPFVSVSRITRSHTSNAGIMVEVTKSGIACRTCELAPPRSTVGLMKA